MAFKVMRGEAAMKEPNLSSFVCHREITSHRQNLQKRLGRPPFIRELNWN